MQNIKIIVEGVLVAIVQKLTRLAESFYWWISHTKSGLVTLFSSSPRRRTLFV
ncbi:hypothetical protein [Chroococcidiopsis sp. CCMEE 29]|uniref:hypothetical protein n=1 Tax=Chroococcidiopsis sp. CCMEE 29 TaxID=155894 RepID=UPI002021FC18|nr:hypothetical protein [Chroococcidiopsis sp. CCMEE 29]